MTRILKVAKWENASSIKRPFWVEVAAFRNKAVFTFEASFFLAKHGTILLSLRNSAFLAYLLYFFTTFCPAKSWRSNWRLVLDERGGVLNSYLDATTGEADDTGGGGDLLSKSLSHDSELKLASCSSWKKLQHMGWIMISWFNDPEPYVGVSFLLPIT